MNYHKSIENLFLLKVKIDIQMVGSCSTLVAKHLLQENYDDLMGLTLLRNTILVDTINLCPNAKKATPTDISILEEIETITKDNAELRQEKFEELDKAKRSIEGFSAVQLMRKDLKVSK